MGFDAFGLPAEQYAVQTGHAPARHDRGEHRQHASASCARSASAHDPRRGPAHHRRRLLPLDAVDLPADLQRAGTTPTPTGPVRSPSWSPSSTPARGRRRRRPPFVGARPAAEQRATASTRYRLAYIAEAPVNWCPGLGTVLANEEVTADGRSERGNFPVYKRPLKQWMMRITAYADRLLADLDLLDWPEPIKLMQRNWIGRSTARSVDFAVDGTPASTSRCSPPGPTRCSAPPTWCSRPSTRWSTRSRRRVAGDARPSDGSGAFGARRSPARGGRARTASSRRPSRSSNASRRPREDRRVHRRVRGQPGQRRADPGVHRRLRADGLRHRRDHGRARARPARLGVRRGVRAADRAA